ncbi:hypothetical protein LEN26_001224 [Aphanomyces euteiches]|nr:hypothetical protein LEN26_001224 [Aphanomyces euteiches]
MPVKLPLPPNFFQCPPLTADEIDNLKRQAYQNAMDVVTKSLVQTTDATVTWSLMANESQLKIYKGDDMEACLGQSGMRLYVGRSEVAGTIDEIVELFRKETTEEAKDYVSRFGRDLLVAANLYTLVQPSQEHPHEHVSINWYAMESPLKKIVMERDSCLLEGHYDFELNGKRGWVRSMKSVNLMCCPDLQHALGLVRMTHAGTGHVFLESDRTGYITMAYVVHADFAGSVAEIAIDVAMRRRCRSLLDIGLFLRENRLAYGPILSVDALVPHHMRGQCFLWQKKFTMFTSKSNCFKCGEVFCSLCNRPWTTKVFGVPTRIEACTKCSLTTSRQMQMNAILDSTKPQQRVSSNSNSSTSDLQIHRSNSGGSARAKSSSNQDHERITRMDKERLKDKWIRELIAENLLLNANGLHNYDAPYSPSQIMPIHFAKHGPKPSPEDEVPYNPYMLRSGH